MELKIKDRIVLSMIMEPQAGRYDVLKMIRQFREDLSFTAEEIEATNLRNEEKVGYRWDKEISKDVPVGDVLMGIIKKQFEKMEQEGRLHETHLDIYEKFIG